MKATLDTSNIPENTPIVMLNLLRYRAEAAYGAGGPARTGREAYFEGYIPAFTRVAGRSERTKLIRPIYVGSVAAHVAVPEGERWDDVALVEYPDIAAFRAVVESEEYLRDAAPHRLAALADTRLIATLKLGP